MQRSANNKAEAAKLLTLPRKTFDTKLRKLSEYNTGE
ncbi:helix-turn-helix domain-containing protein [Pseudomonas sp. No.117]